MHPPGSNWQLVRQQTTHLPEGSTAAPARGGTICQLSWGGSSPLGAGPDMLLTKREAARELGVAERTVDRLLARGILRGLRPTTRAVRLEMGQIDRWVGRGCPERPWREWDR